MTESPPEGRIVSRPPREHICEPGWRNEYVAKGDPLGFGPGWFGVPPHSSDFPKGTVWECHCGQTWVSLGEESASSRFVRWRKERRRERRRREARERAA